MKELVKITKNNGKRAVSARELHKKLKTGTRFNDWIKRRIKQYDLIEGVDYVLLKNEYLGNQALTKSEKRAFNISLDYSLTINCAKELAMIENNAQGKKVRHYFIQMEEERNKLLAAEPIGGVYPIIYNGKIGYPRREILIAAGYSPDSGTVWALKNQWPDDFYTILRTACVSPDFARLRYEQGQVRQLELNFREKRNNKGLKGGEV